MLSPLYTADNCRPAFQLRWSLALFTKADLPTEADWLASLKSVVEPDGVRILEAKLTSLRVWQFLVSTTPEVAPPAIVKSVTHFQDAPILAEVSKNLGEAMVGRNAAHMPEGEKLAVRGW